MNTVTQLPSNTAITLSRTSIVIRDTIIVSTTNIGKLMKLEML